MVDNVFTPVSGKKVYRFTSCKWNEMASRANVPIDKLSRKHFKTDGDYVHVMSTLDVMLTPHYGIASSEMRREHVKAWTTTPIEYYHESGEHYMTIDLTDFKDNKDVQKVMKTYAELFPSETWTEYLERIATEINNSWNN